MIFDSKIAFKAQNFILEQKVFFDLSYAKDFFLDPKIGFKSHKSVFEAKFEFNLVLKNLFSRQYLIFDLFFQKIDEIFFIIFILETRRGPDKYLFLKLARLDWR